MAVCYFAPDWGMALRWSGMLDSEFGDVATVGPWADGFVHGTVFAVASPRFPDAWHNRLCDIDEQPWIEGFGGKVRPHPNPDREKVVLECIERTIAGRVLHYLAKETEPHPQ